MLTHPRSSDTAQADIHIQVSTGERGDDGKKPRRSTRLSQPQQATTPISRKNPQFPSPVTHAETTTGRSREGTISPPDGRPSQPKQITPPSPELLSSPPGETQAFSQFVHPSASLTQGVVDEEAEGVWGYLMPLDRVFGDSLVLRERNACPAPVRSGQLGTGSNDRTKGTKGTDDFVKEEKEYEKSKYTLGFPAGGYLIGRHPECDRVIPRQTISNRHCLFFREQKDGVTIAMVEDLSTNGTFVNAVPLGRNRRRELQDNDQISILDETTFLFRYPANREANAFRNQYRVLQALGKGHFATVYLCVDKQNGHRFAVKRFEKRPGDSERSKNEGLQQEIAVLMGVTHPNLLCLKSTFDEKDAVYLVLELAPEGELFNWIVMKQKLSEDETRKVYIQLLQAVKYLHERGIVHRDIKPENILLADKDLSIKLADFGLAKIIGEESFTTTLCGTPSYVAPEILENSKHRRYTRGVDVWSLGVVLYICLCGFPPFSDELYTRDNPYTLSQQIKMGRFDYPSPYWDSVGDPALDLIDRMLTVDPEKRITVDECLEHPWITKKGPSLTDSTDGLTGAIAGLDFSKRKPVRERTQLSALNSVRISSIVDGGESTPAVKVWEKNQPDMRNVNMKAKAAAAASGKKNSKPAKANGGAKKNGTTRKEASPAAERDAGEFMQMGGKGDEELFANDGESNYP